MIKKRPILANGQGGRLILAQIRAYPKSSFPLMLMHRFTIDQSLTNPIGALKTEMIFKDPRI